MPETTRLWEAKLCVLLHDPIDKVFQLEKHEEISGSLRTALGLTSNHSALAKSADVLASASDRNPLTSSFLAHWVEGPEFYHPLDGVDLLSSPPRDILEERGEGCDDDPGEGTTGAGMREEIIRLSKTPCVVENGVVKECPISAAVRKKLEELKVRFRDGDFRRKQFLYLWRTLDTPLVLGKGKDLSRLVSFLPADSRIPDHGIMDHLVTSTALVPALLRGERLSLVSVDIGGVGKFLSQSRKVRDIWASSYLISLLTLLVTRIVAEELGPDSLIFPDVRGNPLMDLYLLAQEVLTWEEVLELWGDVRGEGETESTGNFFRKLLTPSLPDHVLFLAPESMVGELEERIRQEVESFFQRIGERIVLKFLRKLGIEDELRRVVERQLRGLPYPLSLRIDHVTLKFPSFSRGGGKLGALSGALREELKHFIPKEVAEWRYEVGREVRGASLTNEFADMIAINEYMGRSGWKYSVEYTIFYPIAFLVLQSRMRYAKLTEMFEHEVEPGSEGGRKVTRRCMLCGSRNPLFSGEGRSQEGWRKFIERMEAKGIRERWLFSEREPLCAVDVLKRLLMRRESLISAWSVALGVEFDRLRKIVKEGEELSVSLGKAIGKIPTLDDVAVAPRRNKVVQSSNSDSDSEEDGERELTELMVNALVEVVTCRLNNLDREDKALSLLQDLIAELGRKYVDISDALIIMREREVLREKLARKLKRVEDIPGTLLFPNTWENVRRAMERLNCKTEAVNELLKFFSDNKFEEQLSNYVAIVRLDGDLVGKWISGMMFVETDARLVDRLYCLRTGEEGQVIALRVPECKFKSNPKANMTNLLREIVPKLVELHRLVTPSLHRNMSSILRDLSLIYPDIVDEVGGITLYSAGDELLAAVPAIEAINFVERMIQAYRGHLLRVNGRLHLGMGEKATVSGGVVVAHRLIPMGEMLRAVSKEMTVAKDGSPDSPPGSRNRVSFARMTRGGHYERAVVSGDLLLRGEASSLLSRVRDAIQAEEILSRNFVKDFQEYMERFGAKVYEPGNPRSVEPLVRLSIRRNLHGNEERKSEVEEELTRRYLDLLSGSESESEEWHLGIEDYLELDRLPVELERTQMIHAHRLVDLFIGEVLISG